MLTVECVNGLAAGHFLFQKSAAHQCEVRDSFSEAATISHSHRLSNLVKNCAPKKNYEFKFSSSHKSNSLFGNLT